MEGRKVLLWILMGVLTFLPATTFSQEMVFSARASASKIGIEDVFRLTFILKNAPGSTNYKPPSFSDFIVRGGPSQSQSSQLSIINGKAQQSSTIELTYILQAKKTGRLRIDPLEIIINDKHYFTNAVNIEVVKGSLGSGQAQNRNRSRRGFDPFADEEDEFWQQQQQMMQRMMQRMQQLQQSMLGSMPPGMLPDASEMEDVSELDEKNLHKNIFIKVEVDKTKPYLGEQITAKYKLYTRLNMNMQLTQLPSLNGFWSEDFKIPNPPQASVEIVNGRKYNVFLLKKSALFPQQSGKLVLDPAKAEGEVQVIDMNETNPYYGYNVKNVRASLSSTPITIDVQPLPLQNQPKNFTGGVGNFSIHAETDTKVISTDNAATLRFIISGAGNLNLIGAPQINFPDGLGVSDPQVADTIISRSPHISGRRVFTYYLSPQQPGDFVIPPFEFSYFDPVAKAYRSLSTKAIPVKVIEGDNSTILSSQLPGDIHDIERSSVGRSGTYTNGVVQSWYWSLYVAALLAFGLLLFLHYRKKKEQSNIVAWKNKKANKVAWKRLSTARKLIDQKEHAPFYEEVSKAIWLYLSDKLILPLSILNKENIREQLAKRDVDEMVISKVDDTLSACEMALYSPAGGRHQKEHVLEAATDLIGKLENVLKNKKSADKV